MIMTRFRILDCVGRTESRPARVAARVLCLMAAAIVASLAVAGSASGPAQAADGPESQPVPPTRQPTATRPDAASAQPATTGGSEEKLPAPRPAAPPDKNGTQRKRPTPAASDLDRELLRNLVPDLPLEPPGDADSPVAEGTLPDELDRAVQAMRDVSQRLDRRELTDDTTRLQTSILTDIDSLIERLKQNPPPSSQKNSSTDSPSDPNQQQRQQQQDQAGGRRQQQDQAAGTDASPQPSPSDGKSEESQESNPREARRDVVELARRQALINEVWGHLPPSVRERLLNVGSEKLLPQYEELIRSYYEALAEPGLKEPRR